MKKVSQKEDKDRMLIMIMIMVMLMIIRNVLESLINEPERQDSNNNKKLIINLFLMILMLVIMMIFLCLLMLIDSWENMEEDISHQSSTTKRYQFITDILINILHC